MNQDDFRFFLTAGLFFWKLLHVRPGSQRPPIRRTLGITEAGFLQAGCPSCRPINNVKALKRWWIRSWVKN